MSQSILGKILLVDDDPQALESTRKILELAGYQVTTATDGQEALDRVRPQESARPDLPDLIVTDVRMPRLGGMEFLRALSLCGEAIPVILMTAYGRVEDAVWAMKLGAVDFLTKPFKRQALLAAADAALKRARAHATQAEEGAPELAASGAKPAGMGSVLIGQSQAMRKLKEMIRQVAPTEATVLIGGESGTGKELVSRCLHEQSHRTEGRLIALNCAAFPEQLIESELFGFEKGAFTGATGAREGLFEAAHGGTLFLDEIGDMPFSLQAKLLRTLQEGEVRRIGANQTRKVQARVIAASHRDLRECVRAGTFRQDLLYRLEVVTIHVPALRERMEDLPELAGVFLKRACLRHGKSVHGISEAAMERLLSHTWPGNIRELSNVIERGAIFARGSEIEVEDLPAYFATLRPSSEHVTRPASGAQSISVPLGTSLRQVEELLIRKTLEATSGDKNMTAKLLGINSRTIYRKLDKRGEKEPGAREERENEEGVET